MPTYSKSQYISLKNSKSTSAIQSKSISNQKVQNLVFEFDMKSGKLLPRTLGNLNHNLFVSHNFT